MPVVSALKISGISQAKNVRQAIIDSAGDLSRENILGDLVLVGTYIRPEKTEGGIFRPDSNIAEDEYQGKVGLVLKSGPLAYADWEDNDHKGENAKPGSWVVYSVKDGWAITINGTPCRLVPYDKLRMKISDPSVVF